MSNTTTTPKSSLQSSNFWTNIITVAVGVLLAVVTPDFDLSQQVSGEVTGLVTAIKTANYGMLVTVLFNLGNILYHLFRKK